jgi:glycosyltransferase involved in cell wall biosynthesis
VLVRNGVDVTHFTPEPPVTGPPLAVCVGRCCRQKGQDRLVRAWPLVLARCPDARLAIVGPAPQSPGLRNGIRFTGAVRDVRPWYRAADVVVLPSRWEGLPLTALEALACGTSVVGSGIPGLAEVVAGNVGALVHSGDSAELADAVALRLTDRTLARSEGNAGRAMIVREFDLRDTLDRLAAVTRVASRVVRSRDRPAARGLPASGM